MQYAFASIHLRLVSLETTQFEAPNSSDIDKFVLRLN